MILYAEAGARGFRNKVRTYSDIITINLQDLAEIIGKSGPMAIHVDVSPLLGIHAPVLLHRVPTIFAHTCLELSWLHRNRMPDDSKD